MHCSHPSHGPPLHALSRPNNYHNHHISYSACCPRTPRCAPHLHGCGSSCHCAQQAGALVRDWGCGGHTLTRCHLSAPVPHTRGTHTSAQGTCGTRGATHHTAPVTPVCAGAISAALIRAAAAGAAATCTHPPPAPAAGSALARDTYHSSSAQRGGCHPPARLPAARRVTRDGALDGGHGGAPAGAAGDARSDTGDAWGVAVTAAAGARDALHIVAGPTLIKVIIRGGAAGRGGAGQGGTHGGGGGGASGGGRAHHLVL